MQDNSPSPLCRIGRYMFVFLLAFLLANYSWQSTTAQEKQTSNRRAIAHYSDAAGYQNKGAYALAIEEWRKLLDAYPQDPLASKAWHYLGVCYTQLEAPDYTAATQAFEKALEDKNLEVREESLINLSWCLFSSAREQSAGSDEQRTGLEKAKTRLSEFLKSYGEGSYLDQALFYMGEIEYSLGNAERSIPYYKKLLDTPSLKKSSLRPGALYAIAVAYEEKQQESQALRYFRQFLDEYPEHRLISEVSVRLADLYLKQGKHPEATQLLEGLVRKADGTMNDYALLRLGYAVSLDGPGDQAADYYSQLLEKYPESQHAGTAALSLGQLLFKRGQYEEAVQRFHGVLAAQDSQSADAAHWIAITRLRQGKPEEALQVIKSALQWAEDTPNLVNLQMDYADALYAIPTRLDEAREAYEKIVEEHPQHALAPRAAYNAAFAALQAGKLADARKWSELFLNRFPQDPLRNDVAAVAAEALLQQGEHQAAAQAYRKLRDADKQNPAFNQWSLRLATAYYLAGDYASASKLLKQELLQLSEDNQKAEAQFILGASYLYQEQTAAAIEQFTASHRTSDRWTSADEVLLMLAEAHQRNKDNQAARETLELLLKKYPNTRLKAQVDYKLAQLSAALNDFDQAISRYRAIVASDQASSYHSFANYGIAWCLMQQDEYAEALQQLQPLLRQNLRDTIAAEAQLAAGICLRKTDQIEAAIAALKKFLDTQPTGTSLANGLYELGLAYTQQEDLAEASRFFQRIVEEVPDYAALDQVLYELAWNAQDAGEPTKANKYFQRLADEFPQSEYAAEASYMLAQQQYDAQQFDRAAQTYTSVLERTQDAELREKTQYKLGWSLFQQERYSQAAEHFAKQSQWFPDGPLAVDALFMKAECDFEQERFEPALDGYRAARKKLESGQSTAASDQVKSLIYLHGAQCLRELAEWNECESWLKVITSTYPKSPYLWTAVYELGYCKQKQDQATEALKFYGQVVENNRNEIGARARFMMGEVYFSQRDFRRAIEEFTRVAYGFGGEKAPADIKNWQAKSAFEAARCYEVMVSDLRGDSRDKAMQGAMKFYEEIVRDHGQHELAAQATSRLGELQKLR